MKEDKDINLDDIPETDAVFWKSATIVRKIPKKQVTIRLDVDVIDYFKNNSSQYQTEISDVLKTYVQAHT